MKIIAQTLAAAGLFALAACGGNADDKAADNIEAATENQADALEDQADNVEDAGEAAADKADDNDDARIENQIVNQN